MCCVFDNEEKNTVKISHSEFLGNQDDQACEQKRDVLKRKWTDKSHHISETI